MKIFLAQNISACHIRWRQNAQFDGFVVDVLQFVLLHFRPHERRLKSQRRVDLYSGMILSLSVEQMAPRDQLFIGPSIEKCQLRHHSMEVIWELQDLWTQMNLQEVN